MDTLHTLYHEPKVCDSLICLFLRLPAWSLDWMPNWPFLLLGLHESFGQAQIMPSIEHLLAGVDIQVWCLNWQFSFLGLDRTYPWVAQMFLTLEGPLLLFPNFTMPLKYAHAHISLWVWQLSWTACPCTHFTEISVWNAGEKRNEKKRLVFVCYSPNLTTSNKKWNWDFICASFSSLPDNSSHFQL